MSALLQAINNRIAPSGRPGLKNMIIVDTAWGGERGTNWESGTDLYTLPCIKQGVGTCYKAQEAQLCDDLEGWYGAGRVRFERQQIYVYI